MNKRKLMAGVLVIFLLGVAAGALGTGLYYSYGDSHGRFHHLSPKARTDLIMKRLSSDLDLTDDQQKEIRTFVRQAEDQIAQLKKQSFPQFKAIIDESFASTRKVLNPDQQKILDKLHAEMQQFRRKNKDQDPD